MSKIMCKETDGRDSRDRAFMLRALELAQNSVGQASPNPPVGCLIVRGGRAVGEGWHEYSKRDHAEIEALRQAGPRAAGATAYLTLEPCSHFGRTPPCAPRLVEAGIRKVEVAISDPNPVVSGRGLRLLRSAGVEVSVGLCREDAARLLEPFACHVRTGRPLVVAKAAMSLDGRIGTAAAWDRRITGPEAGRFTQSLRRELDGVLVGVNTVLADDPRLTYRGRRPKSPPLVRVILDGGLRTPTGARVLQGAPETPTIIFCGRESPLGRRQKLVEQGAEVIPVPGVSGRLRLSAVLRILGKRDLLGLLVEGGSEVHWSFVSGRLVDKFYFLVAPVVLGGRDSVPAVGGEGYRRISRAARFKIARMFDLGDDLAIEAYPRYSRSIVSPWLPGAGSPFAGKCRAHPSARR